MFRFRLNLFRRWRWLVIILIGLGLSLLAINQWIISPMLSRKLSAMVGQHLNAQLVIGHLSYQPPYGLVADDCHLVFTSADGSTENLVDVDAVHLKLAQSPFHGGPLLIQELALTNPTVRVIRTPVGIEGSHGLVKPDTPPAANAPPPPPSKKFSDLLQLRHVQIENGRVIFSNRTAGAPATEPSRAASDAGSMQWAGININVNISTTDTADYGFKFAADNSAIAQLQADGTFNVDELAVQLKQFSIAADPQANQAVQQLPPEVQALLQRYGITGKLRIDGSASASAKDPGANSANVTIQLQNASAKLPGSSDAISNLNLTAVIAVDAKEISAKLSGLSAQDGNAKFSMNDGAIFDIDRPAGHWKASKFDGSIELVDPAALPANSHVFLGDWHPAGRIDFTSTGDGPIGKNALWADSQIEILAYPRKFSIQPPGFPLAISQIEGGPLRITGDVLAVKDLNASYGPDQLQMKTGRLAIPPLGFHRMEWTEINASVIMADAATPYPKLLQHVFDAARPTGEYFTAGKITVEPFDRHGAKFDYDFLISSDQATLSLVPWNIQLTQVKADTELFPDHLQVKKLEAAGLGGTISGSGTMATRAPNLFSGTVFGDRLSLAMIGSLPVFASSTPKTLNGLESVQANFSGSDSVGDKSAADLFEAEGQVEVFDGRFWDVPVFAGMVNKTKVGRDALTVAEGAALFRIEHRQVELQNAAVNAPLLGMNGLGTIGFDGRLDLDVVAAPLADWRDQAKKSGIPVVSDVAGDILGALQKVVNTATGTLLYEFHVTGTASQPVIDAIPAPILTKTAAMVFHRMLNEPDKSRPLALLDFSPPPPAPPAAVSPAPAPPATTSTTTAK